MALFAVAALGLLAAVAGQVWHTTAQRIRESELIFVGQQYRQALDSYYAFKAGDVQQYPKRLEDLLNDKRSQTVLRHLRHIYPDPMTGKVDWVLITEGDRIVGVRSRSEAKSFRRAFDGADAAFNGTERYKEWVFRADATEPAP
jgi:type II secretory pathway pseudopilin PulG